MNSERNFPFYFTHMYLAGVHIRQFLEDNEHSSFLHQFFGNMYALDTIESNAWEAGYNQKDPYVEGLVSALFSEWVLSKKFNHQCFENPYEEGTIDYEFWEEGCDAGSAVFSDEILENLEQAGRKHLKLLIENLF